MIGLYFGDLFSALTTVLVVAMMAFIVLSARNHSKITKWGRRVALFIFVGTAISGLSATRDLYATPEAVFSMSSMQSTICSIAGGAIFLVGITTIFLKKQQRKRNSFFLISALFSLQVMVIELSRVVLAW